VTLDERDYIAAAREYLADAQSLNDRTRREDTIRYDRSGQPKNRRMYPMTVRAKVTEVDVTGTIGKSYDKATNTTTLNLGNAQIQSLVSDLLPYYNQSTAAATPGWVSTPANGPQAMASSST
jgi:hypothetical protein